MIAVDTNVLFALAVSGERTGDAVSVFEKDAAWIAPLLWRSEIRSALLKVLRAGRMPLAAALVATEVAEDLLEAEYTLPDDTALALALDSGCSAYDCEFVALAAGFGVPLVTLDRRLQEAFPEIALSPEAFVA